MPPINPPPPITAQKFGAKGDGRRDDGPAIQKGIDELYGQGGGTIFFPPGKYLVDGAGLSLRSNVTLDAPNRFGSTLTSPRKGTDNVYLINAVSTGTEFACSNAWIRNLTLLTKGAGAFRAIQNGNGMTMLYGGLFNVVIDGGIQDNYSVDIPGYSQAVILEHVFFRNFLGASLHIDGNVNMCRGLFIDSFAGFWPDGVHFSNASVLPMVHIAGDRTLVDHAIIETFSGFAALKVSGFHHQIRNMWAESDGSVPGNTWILVDSANNIYFDMPHLLVEGTHKFKMVNSQCTIGTLEHKHIVSSLDIDATSILTILSEAFGTNLAAGSINVVSRLL
jgi:hypothetical protein